jgi:hypothetical protein
MSGIRWGQSFLVPPPLSLSLSLSLPSRFFQLTEISATYDFLSYLSHTPLYYAALNAHLPCAVLLRQAGALFSGMDLEFLDVGRKRTRTAMREAGIDEGSEEGRRLIGVWDHEDDVVEVNGEVNKGKD